MSQHYNKYWFLVLLFGACLLTACARAPVKKVEIFWPVPPDPPRIGYVSSFSEPKDMNRTKSFFKKAVDFIFGEDTEPRIVRPYGVLSDGKGTVYVTDVGLQVVHVFDFAEKSYRQVFKLKNGRLRSPIGVAIDSSASGEEMLYVSDSELNRIFVYDPKGKMVREIGKEGEFQRVAGIAINPASHILYAVDTAGHKVVAFDRQGKKSFEFGKRGSGEGEFNFPTHISLDREGSLYVTDAMNFRIEMFDARGKFTSKFGSLGNTLGSFSKPKGVTIDRHGHVYVVDSLYDTVQIFDKEGRLLLNFGSAGSKEGNFWLPAGISADGQDRIYVADTYNHRVQVFQFLGESNKPSVPASPGTTVPMDEGKTP
jgi:DNA-binding beta-propeller fold protein YncE